ncbi:MAG: cytochrome o ubiquinol oxidase subunit III [Candidatus Dasytiphilus stammeri]
MLLTTDDYEANSNKIFGFWIYLMSDCIIFATLFATYAVMIANGPMAKKIFNLPFVLVETNCLLFSSITYGMAMVNMNKKARSKNKVLMWLFLTFLLGVCFIYMEIYEFHNLINDNFGPNRNGFLSSFFTLVGTHGIHVLSGLIWIVVLMSQVAYRGINATNKTRMVCLSLFWHFLDIIWICVFTVVYLLGTIK